MNKLNKIKIYILVVLINCLEKKFDSIMNKNLQESINEQFPENEIRSHKELDNKINSYNN